MIISSIPSFAPTAGICWPERRQQPRIYYPFPASVQGVDLEGNNFQIETTIDNLCANCLYIRLLPQVAAGANVRVKIRLSAVVTNVTTGPNVLLTGVVKRADNLPGGVNGLALMLNRYRLL